MAQIEFSENIAVNHTL